MEKNSMFLSGIKLQSSRPLSVTAMAGLYIDDDYVLHDQLFEV
jgi:hypothetical protein